MPTVLVVALTLCVESCVRVESCVCVRAFGYVTDINKCHMKLVQNMRMLLLIKCHSDDDEEEAAPSMPLHAPPCLKCHMKLIHDLL